jgi:polar amino acid transport system permease protein
MCADPSTLSDFLWFVCYLTTGKHLNFYASFGTVLLLLAVTAPAALLLGFGGAMMARSRIAPLAGSARATSRWCAACRTSPSSCSS